MSDVRPPDYIFNTKLAPQPPSLKYVSQSMAENVAFTFDIPFPMLKAWNEFLDKPKNEEAEEEEHVDGELTEGPIRWELFQQRMRKKYKTYTDLFELIIPDNLFSIKKSDEVRKELNESLRKLASSVNSQYRQIRGRKGQALNSKIKKFHVFERHVQSVAELERENEQLRELNTSLHEEIEEWKSNYANLEEEKRVMFQEMQAEIRTLQNDVEKAETTNKELLDYIELIQRAQQDYKGKDISEAKKKSRTLKTFMTRAQTALWFAKSFGLEVESIAMKEIKTGSKHNATMASAEQQENTATGLGSLSEEEKEKVEQILFLLDKFCVGDSFYHELSMLNDDLPKSYLIKQRRTQLNDMCHIISTPGKAEGAEVSFKELLNERVQDFINQNPEFDFENESVKVKISGDGARMTRNTSFIILSFALLQNNSDLMSARGNHTIAIVKGSEKYETLKESFANVFSDINDLNSGNKITINGKEIALEFFLGGDYKFILIMLGLKGATSFYACAWCKVHKDKRWDMNYEEDYYNKPPLQRTLRELKAFSKKSKENYCCEHEPLLNIELDHVILDELHLLLRVVDVLLNNLLEDVIQWDMRDDINKKKGEKKGVHRERLQAAVRSCGVSFDIWEKTNADGKGSGTFVPMILQVCLVMTKSNS